jgi:hypothetical protein
VKGTAVMSTAMDGGITTDGYYDTITNGGGGGVFFFDGLSYDGCLVCIYMGQNGNRGTREMELCLLVIPSAFARQIDFNARREFANHQEEGEEGERKPVMGWRLLSPFRYLRMTWEQ